MDLFIILFVLTFLGGCGALRAIYTMRMEQRRKCAEENLTQPKMREYMMHKEGCKEVYVVETDATEAWLERSGIYNEQVDNMIMLIKDDLKANGMS